MNNIRVSIDLTKVEGARTIKAKAPNGNNEYYVAIPVSSLFVPKDTTSAYLTLTMIPSPNALYGDFMLKPYVNGNAYQAMSNDERNAIPIIGKGTYIKQKLDRAQAQKFQAAEVETVSSLPPTETDQQGNDQQTNPPAEFAPSSNAPFPANGGTPVAETLFVRTHDGRCFEFKDWPSAQTYAEQSCNYECSIELWRGSECQRRYIYNSLEMQWEHVL